MISGQKIRLSLLLWQTAACLTLYGAEKSVVPAANLSGPKATNRQIAQSQAEAPQIRPINTLTRELALKHTNLWVRVQGRILDQKLGEYVILRDHVGSIRAETSQTLLVDGGAEVVV
ncbi:MAG TPA: hypothetical protein VKA67_09140, partial [Verrucomicrobiae bacterium]|nr:hypothetical protein [Verrucomicrobiae bacterium]